MAGPQDEPGTGSLRGGRAWLRPLSYVLIGLTVVGGLLMAGELSTWPKRQSDKVPCTANLMAIGRGLLGYAGENGRSLPATLDPLVRQKWIHPKELICPGLGAPLPGAQSSYVYISGQSLDGDPTNVLAYELLGNHRPPGGNVLFVNGRVAFLAPADHAAAIARTQARLAARRTTRPTTQRIESETGKRSDSRPRG